MSDEKKPEGETKARLPSESRGERSDDVPVAIAKRALGEIVLGALYRFETLLAIGGLAFAGLFLVIGWQFGPLAMVQAHEYKKFTGHVDASIVESWLALEFDASTVRVPSNWRASTNAARCEVAEYGGDWGTPLRRAFCGTRVPFNDSYLLADLRDISPGVPFAWARDEHGFIVPEIRVDPSTRQWLASHAPDKFMHDKWPANTALDWLRLELDRPIDDAIAGWTAPAPLLPLSFDPARPGDALPTAIVEKRLAYGPSWIAMLMGFGVGLVVWFKAMALMPVLSNLAPMGRWILSALPLLTLPWWMDAFPQTLSHFSRDIASILEDMFADIDRTDRLIASDPAQATLAGGDRLVWRLGDSVYADTIGRFQLAQPNPRPASDEAALSVFTETITAQARVLDDAKRAELFANLERDKRAGLTAAAQVFLPAANEAAADPAAGPATRRAARRFVE